MERYNPLRRPSHRPLLKIPRSPAYLAILDLLQGYDALPSSYIKSSFSSPLYVEKCLTNLQKARLVEIPDGYDHLNALYRVRPLALSSLGERFLTDAARFRPRLKGNDHFKHRYLRSVLKFSRDQAATLPGITIHGADAIRRHPKTPDRTRQDQRFASIPTRDSFIHPDDFWGIEYRTDSGRAFMFFHEEDDRDTEPRRSESPNRRKGMRQMIRDYRDYIEAAGYKSRYGLPQISVLINTTADPATLFEIIREECAPSTAKSFLIKQVPDFLNEPNLMPPPTAHIIIDPYFRVEDGGIRPFSILETLARTAERKTHDRRIEA